MKKIIITILVIALLGGIYILFQKNTGQNNLNINNKEVSDKPATIDTSIPSTVSDGEGTSNESGNQSGSSTGESINL